MARQEEIGTRRRFLQQATRVSAGFFGLRLLGSGVIESGALAAGESNAGYGPLLSDPQGILDLPAGFHYKIISRTGDRMADGLTVPGLPDGMATFPGPSGFTILIRNHELQPEQPGPFGKENQRLDEIDRTLLYDADPEMTVCTGGTTTIIYDTQRQQLVRQFLSLGGTVRNCAGGPTPWNSWISCEEADNRPGYEEATQVTLAKYHGYNFEVPATANMILAPAVPLVAMGRFRHEAVAVDPETDIVYQTEDRDDGLLYRFLPNQRKKLTAGGKLQALAIQGRPSCDTRNWNQSPTIRVGDKFSVEWIDMLEPESPHDDLRMRGFAAGAACFARGEGMWYGDHEFYFACTSGGAYQRGQIWRYRPHRPEIALRESNPSSPTVGGELELFIESDERGLIENADNLTIAPWGDLVVCEDRQGFVVRLIGVTTTGVIYPLALQHLRSELSGVTFSPDGSTLFVNIQARGLTLAITGPWVS